MKSVNFNDYISNRFNPSQETFQRFKINDSKLSKLISGVSEIEIKNFPVANGIYGTAVLKRKQSVIDANSQIFIAGKNKDIPSNIPVISVFQGNLKESPDAKVFVYQSSDFFISAINYPDGKSFVISPEKGSDKMYILSSGSSFADKLYEYKCLVDEKKLINNIETKEKHNGILSDKLLQVEIAMETDSEFFKNTGSDTNKAKHYLLALMSLVSYYYELEANISFYVKWLKIWTDSPTDPYNVKGDAYALPEKVKDYWKANYSDVKRDLFHVMTSIGYGGGGFGYYNALCGKNGDYAFSVSSVQAYHNLPTFAFTYDAYIVAHEIGHNFNAPHSHNCYWGAPLDTCMTGEAIDGKCLDTGTTPRPNPGSIMSYCGGINNQNGLGWQVRMTFLPPVIALIRSTAENADCLQEPPKQMISLLSPHGQEQFKAGEDIIISWKSALINVLSLQYSEDNGQKWHEITKNYPAANGSYKWKTPYICSSKMLVRAFDNNNPEYGDTSLLNFTISMEDTSGLVAYYPFNKNSNDEQICHRYNAQNRGATLASNRSAMDSSACQFNASSYLYVPNFDARFDELSISLWFYADEASGKMNLVGTNWEEGWVFESYYWGSIGASYYIDGAGVPEQIWGNSPEPKKWHHYGFTFDGTEVSLYIDGVKKNKKTFTEKHKLNQFGSTPLYIGSRREADYFKGKIDDIRIYKKALTDMQMLLLAQEVPVNVTDDIANSNSDVPKISPNPGDGLFQLSIGSKFMNNSELTVFNQLGIKIMTIDEISSGIVSIDLSGYPAGIYFFRIASDASSEAGRIILIK